MWMAIGIVVGLAVLYIVLMLINSKVEEPAGCEERRKEMCDVCQMASSCKSKKEEN